MASRCPVHQIIYAAGFLSVAVLAWRTHGAKGLFGMPRRQQIELVVASAGVALCTLYVCVLLARTVAPLARGVVH